jgi:hypothetical protein
MEEWLGACPIFILIKIARLSDSGAPSCPTPAGLENAKIFPSMAQTLIRKRIILQNASFN